VLGAKGFGLTAVCVYRSFVFVGCDDGSLRIWSSDGIGEDGARARTELVLHEAVPKFSKRGGIRSLQVRTWHLAATREAHAIP